MDLEVGIIPGVIFEILNIIKKNDIMKRIIYLYIIIIIAFISCKKDVEIIMKEDLIDEDTISYNVLTSPNSFKSAYTAYVYPCPGDFDGDGKCDISIKNGYGVWAIDYAFDGFGTWGSTITNLSVYGNNYFFPSIADFDGDGRDDILIYSLGITQFSIDYSSNGFGGADVRIKNTYYIGNSGGNANEYGASGDFDGDGLADWSRKRNSGIWCINYAYNGFGVSYIGIGDLQEWDDEFPDYSSSPVSLGDFDGDGKTDLSVKTDDGRWLIDWAKNGFSTWDKTYFGYGGSSSIPAPADYDGDGKTDLSVKISDGRWLIDWSNNGFGTWDKTYYGYGGSNDLPYPRDYDGDGKADLSVVSESTWYIDYSNNGFGRWDVTRGI